MCSLSKEETKVLHSRIQSDAARLKSLLIGLPNHDAITDVLDYVLGAYYGLTRAIEFGFIDRPGPWHSTYRPHLTKYLEEITNNIPPHDSWLAGFFFNSGIQRLAACFDRIPKLLGVKRADAHTQMRSINKADFTAWEKVYVEVNAFKHYPAGKSAGRSVTLNDALQALEQAIGFLKANESKLVADYH